MLPTLDSFGIITPVYIRKMDSRTHWNPEGCNSQQERAQKVAIDIFKDGVNSLYRVNSNQDFYGMVAAISKPRTSKDKNIDFVWMTEEELREVGIELVSVVEGHCLRARYLHFHVDMDISEATRLCDNLMAKNREPKRCQRKDTIQVLGYLEALGCKAIVTDSPICKCEN